jgi:biopolymer transport protein TolR
MADIMLVLLIIFMITAPLMQEGIYINKAKAAHAREAPELEAENVVTVTITRDQIIYVQEQAVLEEELVDWISEYMNLAEGKPLFVRSDIAAPYGKVVEVVNKARDAGVEQIGLVVDRVQREGL